MAGGGRTQTVRFETFRERLWDIVQRQLPAVGLEDDVNLTTSEMKILSVYGTAVRFRTNFR